MEHIEEIKKKLPNEYKKILFIFDRGYIGIPMLLYKIKQEGNYLFRLPTRTYKKEILPMTTDDEKVIIPITNKSGGTMERVGNVVLFVFDLLKVVKLIY